VELAGEVLQNINNKMKNKTNKKAFIRILEAIIGILIIMAVVLIIASNKAKKSDISEEVHEKQRYILNVISNNESMRSEIINGKTDSVNLFVSKNIPSSWAFTTNICGVEEVCNQNTPNDKDIYVSETIISANLTDYPDSEISKLRFFIWRK